MLRGFQVNYSDIGIIDYIDEPKNFVRILAKVSKYSLKGNCVHKINVVKVNNKYINLSKVEMNCQKLLGVIIRL